MPVPDKTPTVARPSARALVFEQLRTWIEDGTLVPGEVIKDIEIAGKLGVSRTPVREALKMLEQLGAVETEPGRRTCVAHVGPADAALIYPPLGALQAVAAELATPKITDADIEAMSTANERVFAAAERGNPVAAREADDAFHGVLIERSDNTYLAAAIRSLQLHSRRLDIMYFTQHGPTHESYEEHRRIIEAVARRDPEAARELTRQNFVRTIKVLLAEDP